MIFEPCIALTAANNGIADIEQLIQQARLYLTDGGWLMIEHGFEQSVICRSLFTEANYTSVISVKDLAGHERMTMGQWFNIAKSQTNE